MKLGIFEPRESPEIDELHAVTQAGITGAEEGTLWAFSIHAVWVLAAVAFVLLIQSDCVHQFFARLDSFH